MKKNFQVNKKFLINGENSVDIKNINNNVEDNEGRIMYIDWDALVPHPSNRKESVNTNINRLADSIRTFGLIDALRVKDIGNGKYSITSGERRWRAIKLIKSTDPSFMSSGIRCFVAPKDTDDIDEEARMIEANMEREDYTPGERREYIKRLYEIYNEKIKRGDVIPESLLDAVNSKKINPISVVAKALGVSDRQIQKVLSINDYLAPYWIHEFDEGNVSINNATAISHLSPEKQQNLFDIYKEKGELDTEDIKTFKQIEKEENESKAKLEEKYKEMEKLLDLANLTGNDSVSEKYHKVSSEIDNIKEKVKRQENNVQKRSTQLRLFNCINNLEKAYYAVERAMQHQELREEDILRLQLMGKKIEQIVNNQETHTL